MPTFAIQPQNEDGIEMLKEVPSFGCGQQQFQWIRCAVRRSLKQEHLQPLTTLERCEDAANLDNEQSLASYRQLPACWPGEYLTITTATSVPLIALRRPSILNCG